jgi:hypothetical protein
MQTTNTQKPDTAVATTEALAQWRDAVARDVAAYEALYASSRGAPGFDDLDIAAQHADSRLRQLAREAWARSVSGWADIVLLAEIAKSACWADYHSQGTRDYQALLAAQDTPAPSQFGERAMAHLVKAILGHGIDDLMKRIDAVVEGTWTGRRGATAGGKAAATSDA